MGARESCLMMPGFSSERMIINECVDLKSGCELVIWFDLIWFSAMTMESDWSSRIREMRGGNWKISHNQSKSHLRAVFIVLIINHRLLSATQWLFVGIVETQRWCSKWQNDTFIRTFRTGNIHSNLYTIAILDLTNRVHWSTKTIDTQQCATYSEMPRSSYSFNRMSISVSQLNCLREGSDLVVRRCHFHAIPIDLIRVEDDITSTQWIQLPINSLDLHFWFPSLISKRTGTIITCRIILNHFPWLFQYASWSKYYSKRSRYVYPPYRTITWHPRKAPHSGENKTAKWIDEYESEGHAIILLLQALYDEKNKIV
jgi:hypothetical protein